MVTDLQDDRDICPSTGMGIPDNCEYVCMSAM
ncbi:MAG: hypothetical protein A4E54_00382 [Pelotomaculum sp. PtaB.Bin117]|nr:MAG: hypothetical protein A4E54_00382 [Pelotomaculum sp. PtaB.Bin117]OPY60392.1 MAG: hypothetical protein A4E56_02725 [Pelotomaculum sp. PtaU1.Bin065]